MGEYRGDQYLFQGLANLGRGVEEAVSGWKKTKAMAKASDTMFDHLSDEEKPYHPEEWKNLSSNDRISAMQGILQAQGYKQGQQDLLGKIASTQATQVGTAGEISRQRRMEKLLPQELAMGTESVRRLKAGNDEADDLRNRLASFNEGIKPRVKSYMDPGFVGPQQPLGADELMARLAESGLLMDPKSSQADNILSTLGRSAEMARHFGQGAEPQEKTLGGNSFVFSPKTGMILPNPKREAPDFQPITDESGAVIGHASVDPRTGRPILIKAPGPAGSKDILAYEKALSDLDQQISAQEMFAADPKYKQHYNKAQHQALTRRRAGVLQEYDRAFPNSGRGDGVPEPPPAATRPAGRNPTVDRNGKIKF